MDIKAKVEPIKVDVVPIGNVRPGAPGTSATVRIRFTTPSRRVHWMIQIGWDGNATFDTKTWSLYPLMVDPINGSQILQLQPGVVAEVLPSGYEAESGVKMWEAVLNFESDDTNTSRIFAVLTWEPSVVDMCEEERTYWAGHCSAERKTPLADIGGSLRAKSGHMPLVLLSLGGTFATLCFPRQRTELTS